MVLFQPSQTSVNKKTSESDDNNSWNLLLLLGLAEFIIYSAKKEKREKDKIIKNKHIVKISLSMRYSDVNIKKYCGTVDGSSSLWGCRLLKAYGILSLAKEHHIYPDFQDGFGYDDEQISIARHLRSGFYKRLFSAKEIISALNCSDLFAVSLDVEIFDSIFNDQDGIISMPDEEDAKEDVSHCFTITGYDQENDVFQVDSGWSEWENNGKGLMLSSYLDKYILTAMVSNGFPELDNTRRKKIFSQKKHFHKNKYYANIYLETNFGCDIRDQLNLEVTNDENVLVGWAHYAIDENRVLELLDIFVINEYRRLGIGSFILRKMMEFTRTKSFTGFVPAQDLVGKREEIVRDFFYKNRYFTIVDKGQFKDCRYRVEHFKK